MTNPEPQVEVLLDGLRAVSIDIKNRKKEMDALFEERHAAWAKLRKLNDKGKRVTNKEIADASGVTVPQVVNKLAGTK